MGLGVPELLELLTSAWVRAGDAARQLLHGHQIRLQVYLLHLFKLDRDI